MIGLMEDQRRKRYENVGATSIQRECVDSSTAAIALEEGKAGDAENYQPTSTDMLHAYDGNSLGVLQVVQAPSRGRVPQR